jgi:mannose-6-phosphate isomerase-like protein (cupin superfamily)
MTTQCPTTAVWKQETSKEFLTPERCHIFETYNTTDDASLSIARARVERGVTTAWHVVEHTIERYIIAEGQGRVEVGDFPATTVGPGDVVIIPSATRQRITNIGAVDLIFYCVCMPRFQAENYRSLE